MSKKVITKKLVLVNEAVVTRKPVKKDDPTLYSWKIYFKEPSDSSGEPKLSSWISSVTYKLHPTFREPEQEYSDAPFLLAEEGWGTFPIGISVKFKDDLAPPHEFQYLLSFSPTSSHTETITFENPSAALVEILTRKKSSSKDKEKEKDRKSLSMKDAGRRSDLDLASASRKRKIGDMDSQESKNKKAKSEANGTGSDVATPVVRPMAGGVFKGNIDLLSLKRKLQRLTDVEGVSALALVRELNLKHRLEKSELPTAAPGEMEMEIELTSMQDKELRSLWDWVVKLEDDKKKK